MHRSADPRFDIGFALFVIAVCAAVLWETRRIPPGTFEPLGSAPAPQAVATLVIVLGAVIVWRAWRRLRAGSPSANAGEDPVSPRWADAAAVGALTFLYALVLHSRLVRFDVATTVYLFATIGLLVRFERRLLAAVGAVAAVTGFGCQYVFTRVFVVDLPGAF